MVAFAAAVQEPSVTWKRGYFLSKRVINLIWPKLLLNRLTGFATFLTKLALQIHSGNQ